jgi:hypothetical protein
MSIWSKDQFLDCWNQDVQRIQRQAKEAYFFQCQDYYTRTQFGYKMDIWL